ncbi:MAG: hypothetical protein ACKV22_14720 [Bryobacteraceae bacterium]
MSEASATGFRISGSWRQQFDWAVVEWNRDNTFEHPLFRKLPDGDLSGLQLTYEEERTNCISIDSNLYPTVDWPYLRLWVENGLGDETVRRVPLKAHAVVVSGSYQPASATFTLGGSPTPDDYVEVAWLSEHFTHRVAAGESLVDVVANLTSSINAANSVMTANASGASITLRYTGEGSTVQTSTIGANGNRIGVYTNVAGAQTESWQPSSSRLSGGTSPTRWRISLDFSNLRDTNNDLIPTSSVRKMRWTYSADLQPSSFERQEFLVVVSDWQVSGSKTRYKVAGEGSRRVEDDAPGLLYTGDWGKELGNYSGGSIRSSDSTDAAVHLAYRAQEEHSLFLGTRRTASSARLEVLVDGAPVISGEAKLEGEDVLVRLPLGVWSGGVDHVVTLRRASSSGNVYFDFLEIAYPHESLPAPVQDPSVTLATDWDTDHSLALPPERTAWILNSLGFRGRANHYVGALLFYELVAAGNIYAQADVDFVGTPTFSAITELRIGSGPVESVVQHLNLIGDTSESIAKAFELVLNSGYTAIWAESSGSRLTVRSRSLGTSGNSWWIGVSPNDSGGSFYGQIFGRYETASGKWFLDGGSDPTWQTDLSASPRLNRAVRDWSTSYFAALRDANIPVTAAFSMEVQHGDASPAASIAQRYPNGEPVLLNTPAIQTNFGPESLMFWKHVYRDMAQIMFDSQVPVYLQFGEVQWWYFPNASGMPYYDNHTTSTFQSTFGRPLPVFSSNSLDPDMYSEETHYLSGLIGSYTSNIISFVRQSFADSKFEVLFPLDVNESAWNTATNFPQDSWVPTHLNCLKTENFGYTLGRDLNKAKAAVVFPLAKGFARTAASHLIGVSDHTTPWAEEVGLSKGEGLESAVIWAMDQFCLIGYPIPIAGGDRKSHYLG